MSEKTNKSGKFSRSPALIELGDRIRYYRTKVSHMSQEEFASGIGLHRTYLSAVERGEYNLTIMTLILITKGLGVDLEELVKDIDDLEIRVKK